jgi:hypothetical protein
MIDRCVKSHRVGKMLSWSYSSYFAAAAVTHHSPMMLLPGQHGTTTNLAWRLPHQWLSDANEDAHCHLIRRVAQIAWYKTLRILA